MNIKENYKNTEHKQREEKTKKQSKIGLILGVDKKSFKREKKQKKHNVIIRICKYRRSIKE